jgi:chromosome segregation and condensation protein ScpB
MSEEKYSDSDQKQPLDLTALVEAILFVSPEPISAKQIGTIQ